jgi:hypothetical protein
MLLIAKPVNIVMYVIGVLLVRVLAMIVSCVLQMSIVPMGIFKQD